MHRFRERVCAWTATVLSIFPAVRLQSSELVELGDDLRAIDALCVPFETPGPPNGRLATMSEPHVHEVALFPLTRLGYATSTSVCPGPWLDESSRLCRQLVESNRKPIIRLSDHCSELSRRRLVASVNHS